MTYPRFFTSHPTHHETNVREGLELRAVAALMADDYGRKEPAVAVFAGQRIRFVIPTAQALRIANEIADAVETVERSSNGTYTTETPQTESETAA